jgi:hypothetical protein
MLLVICLLMPELICRQYDKKQCPKHDLPEASCQKPVDDGLDDIHTTYYYTYSRINNSPTALSI